MNKVHYNPKLKKLARKLRRNMTLSEVLLWNQLKQGKIQGYDFHRQKPIDNYIVDFFCPKLNLIIEVDGKSHQFKGEEDVVRQKKLESLGFHFLRFKDKDIKQKMNDILEIIRNYINEKEDNTPPG
jgi:very-short-patch-repair endonuclease